MASKHKEGLNVKEKVSGGKRAMSDDLIYGIRNDVDELKEKHGELDESYCSSMELIKTSLENLLRRVRKLEGKDSGGEKEERRIEQMDPDCSDYDDPIPNSKQPKPKLPSVEVRVLFPEIYNEDGSIREDYKEPSENDYEQFVQAYEGYWKKKYDEALSKFVEKLSFICYNMENRNWDNIDKLINEYKARSK